MQIVASVALPNVPFHNPRTDEYAGVRTSAHLYHIRVLRCTFETAYRILAIERENINISFFVWQFYMYFL